MRERYSFLATDFRKRIRQEAAASGNETDVSEVDKALEENIEVENAAETLQKDIYKQKAQKENNDRENGEKMRLQAIEKLGETQKRKALNDEMKKPLKRRSSGSDVVNYLKEKSAAMNAWKNEEMELRRMKLEAESKRHNELMQIMMNQQQQKQQNDLIISLPTHIYQKK